MSKKNIRNLIILIVVIAIGAISLFSLKGDNKEKGELISCTISVKCDSLLGNEAKLSETKRSLIPEGGIFIDKKTVSVKKGATVFDLLVSEAEKSRLQIDFAPATPGSSAYVKGIGNIYEGDAGDLSGWTYKVNSKSASVGASDFVIENGDEIEWIYSCDLLKDFEM